eukprot:CAMPEP_0172305532 /NCGR_PEP_ID=MMETSP1058-20130122/6794_1 /TAXON_ID=83371 /ORGANISM="Detonula confervacea, Strain CCMP 353" /LENGTH=428 /DNA_ID=CAMNT_0013017153 /DNA_START=446 /DNA_END=1732 /DNA_ORIENTATION=-
MKCRIAVGRSHGLFLLHVALAAIFFKNASALSVSTRHSHAASKKKSTQTQSLNNTLQKCFTPKSILDDVGRYITPKVDPQGTLSSLILIRLSKYLVNLENTREFGDGDGDGDNKYGQGGNEDHIVHLDILNNVLNTLASANWESSNRSLEAAVEGTKAASVLSRLLKEDATTWEPLIRQWHDCADEITAARLLEPHHLSGLKFSMDGFRLLDDVDRVPLSIQNDYDALNLPFRIQPDMFGNIKDYSVSGLKDEADFQNESIRTTSNRVVKERRQTAWQGDEHVAPFGYSGKSMERKPFSPIVLNVRDQLSQQTGHHYDGCLLNLYPDGGSGMRYHSDPDQGSLWGYETVVASVGATRKFAFRAIPKEGEIGGGNANQDSSTHVFTLMHGDCCSMFGDCQQIFQHTVKNADVKNEKAARASLVFKKTLI